jgi:hypothetical protein
MSCLCYLCLLAHRGDQHILCGVFVLLVFVVFTLCCQFLWIVHCRLLLRSPLTSVSRFFTDTTDNTEQLHNRTKYTGKL